MAYEIVVIGTSWGGLAALRELIGALPGEFVLPVVIVQHRHRQSDQYLVSLIQDRTRMSVCEVEDKMPIAPRSVFIAPADYHLLIEHGSFALTTDPPVRYSRPSIDVTLNSAADSYGSTAIGIVLTGANADGAQGLRRLADRGGLPVVQRPESAEVPTMPRSALNEVPEARTLSLSEIGSLLVSLPGAVGTAAATGPS